MPITLADAQKNTQDDVDFNVIDMYRRYSYLLDRLTFDDCVNPGTGGATLTYGYTQLVNTRKATFRSINSEYTASQASRTRKTVDLVPLGGAFEVDRVIADLGSARTNEVNFQMDELLKGSVNGFIDQLVNGDTAVTTNGFDGLDAMLAGTTSEVVPTGAGYFDITVGTVDTQAKAINAVTTLEEFIAKVVGGADVIVGNQSGLIALARIGRLAGYLSESEDAFGRPLTRFAGIPLVDAGTTVAEGDDTETSVIPTESRDTDGTGTGGSITNLTDLYAVKFGLDAFHAVSKTGPLVKTWLPDFSTAGAVKKGEVEMVAAPVLKRTTGAAVLRNIKIK
ncbi:major capsid protein [Nocardioides sp. YIM 152315]|uniref:major capsid protein n=1 Tax=Nocardioides sp. YIM 152315 TaxID=3031760 RepID=UPI0023DCCA96|nr:hypothetical protein [Nocardioides sp. YIM 152315]MDF1603391.1 hypothetical protein [Nocardioides sp. YIM 152315]